MPIIIKIYNKVIYRLWIKLKLKKVGSRFRIGYSSELTTPAYFSIGDNFFTGPRNYLSTNRYNPVSIGDHVMFGPECMVIGGNHDSTFTDGHMSFNSREDHMKSSIVIEDGVWIGARSMILSNAYIGEGAIVGAMSLVNHEIPPYCTAVGIPAKKFMRRFQNNDDLQKLLNNVNSKYSLKQLLSIYKDHGIQ